MIRITATEANHSFFRLLAEVRSGKSVHITVRGEVVAEIRPVSKAAAKRDAGKQKAWDALIERLRTQPLSGVPPGTCDELYDRD